MALFVVVAPACGGGDDDGEPAQQAESSQSADDQTQACDVLTKAQVEEALGVENLSDVTDEATSCAYGAAEDEAQVTFSVAELVGGAATFEDGLEATKETLGQEKVREFSGLGAGAYAVDNGTGSFFAQAFDGVDQISIYIYVSPETDVEEIFSAAEDMLGAAVPKI